MENDIERLVIAEARNGSAQAPALGRQERAEEITQRMFVTAARRIGDFQFSQATFRTWLLGMARRHHSSLVAREVRRKRHERSTAENPGSIPEGSDDLRLHEALARLPQRCRQILEAKYLRQQTLNETAAMEELNVEAIESRLRRARQRFAEVYEQMKS